MKMYDELGYLKRNVGTASGGPKVLAFHHQSDILSQMRLYHYH